MALFWQHIDQERHADELERWRRGDPADLYDLPDIAQLLDRPSWHTRAACRGQGTERWFLQRGMSGAQARAFCDICPVRAQCLRAAMEMPDCTDSGIWAGTTAKQRARLRRQAASTA